MRPYAMFYNLCIGVVPVQRRKRVLENNEPSFWLSRLALVFLLAFVICMGSSSLGILVLDALDLVALHHGGQNGTILRKEFVIVAALVGSFGDALEIVEIQLTLKRTEATHTKVLGHDVLDKVTGLVDRKGPAVG